MEQLSVGEIASWLGVSEALAKWWVDHGVFAVDPTSVQVPRGDVERKFPLRSDGQRGAGEAVLKAELEALRSVAEASDMLKTKVERTGQYTLEERAELLQRLKSIEPLLRERG